MFSLLVLVVHPFSDLYRFQVDYLGPFFLSLDNNYKNETKTDKSGRRPSLRPAPICAKMTSMDFCSSIKSREGNSTFLTCLPFFARARVSSVCPMAARCRMTENFWSIAGLCLAFERSCLSWEGLCLAFWGNLLRLSRLLGPSLFRVCTAYTTQFQKGYYGFQVPKPMNSKAKKNLPLFLDVVTDAAGTVLAGSMQHRNGICFRFLIFLTKTLWVRLRWFFILYHGKSPLNYHLGTHVSPFQASNMRKSRRHCRQFHFRRWVVPTCQWPLLCWTVLRVGLWRLKVSFCPTTCCWAQQLRFLSLALLIESVYWLDAFWFATLLFWHVFSWITLFVNDISTATPNKNQMVVLKTKNCFSTCSRLVEYDVTRIFLRENCKFITGRSKYGIHLVTFF